MNHLWRGLLIGSLIAIAGTTLFFSPWGMKVEEEFGLAMLFKIRGSRPPPGGVVIVNIDQDPSFRLGLPENFSVWPRTIHARIVDRLKSLGAGAIAFDVHFVEARNPADDLVLAESIRRAGNVILFAELKRQTIDQSGRAREAGKVDIDILVPPIPPLADAALALAPFPIPKRPVRINQTWLFKQSAGEMPTLPVVVLQTMDYRHDAYLQALHRRNMPDRSTPPPATSMPAAAATAPVDSIRAAREIFKQRPELATQLLSEIAAGQTALPSPADRTLLQALVRMSAGKDNIHINYYGPPATFPTLSYSEILSPEAADLAALKERIRGRAVFIGAAKKTWSGQKDGFYTVFSQPDELDLSGVEIAATVYANNVIGDSMLALWPSVQPLAAQRAKACQAALQIQFAVSRFNRTRQATPLPTRIGLHYGYLLMGKIGAESHFEYAPVGDIVNTASRIEGLNKLLGTRILASEATVEGVAGVLTRKLGMFLFAGKTQPIAIRELLSADEEVEKQQETIVQIFPEALNNFQQRHWSRAIEGFRQRYKQFDSSIIHLLSKVLNCLGPVAQLTPLLPCL